MRGQSGEQLIELLIRDRPRDPHRHPRPVPARPLRPNRIHRVAVRVRPAGSPAADQRERIHDRAAARVQMKGIETAQHRFTVRHRRRRVLRPRRRFARHRIRDTGPPGTAGRRRPSSRRDRARPILTGPPPMRADSLVTALDPAAEIPRLDLSRSIPTDVDRPQEPEPAQQIHPIGASRGRRPTGRLQVTQITRDRPDDPTRGVHQSIRLEQIPRRDKRPATRNHQRRQIPRHIRCFDHDTGR